MQNVHACLTFLLLCAVVFLSSKLLMQEEGSLVETAQLRASDAGQSPAHRLEALQMLRSYGLAEPYLCPEYVVESVLRLARETEVPEVRVVIYQQLNGLDYPILRDPLLNSLLNDPSYEVRIEAARTLRMFREDPEVEKALTQAQESDESEDVRKQAEATLSGEDALIPIGGSATKGSWESEQ